MTKPKRKNSYNDWRVAKTSRYSASWTYRYSPKLWPCRASCSAHLYLRLREKFSVSDYEEAMSSAHLPAHLPAYLPAYHPAYFPNPIVVSIFETLILHLFFIGCICSKAEHDLEYLGAFSWTVSVICLKSYRGGWLHAVERFKLKRFRCI